MLLSRMILAALLVLHPFGGIAPASAVTDECAPCGGVCCCGPAASCGCAAEETPDAPEREPAAPSVRTEMSDAAAAGAPTPAWSVRTRIAPRWACDTVARRVNGLEAVRLLCVWRT